MKIGENDLISRAEAKEAIRKKFPNVSDRCEINEVLNSIPAVDAVPVVRCAYCKQCFDMGSDPMEPYDGESEWYCARFDRDTSAYEIDPYRFFCADGERRESE